MNKGELIELVSKRTNIEQSKCKKIFNGFKEVVIEVLNKGGEIEIKDFGKFSTKETKQRLYCNPITHRKFFSLPKKLIILKLFKNFKYSIK